jgi:translation elongation factor EF-4
MLFNSGNFKADGAGKMLKHQKEGKEKMKVIGNVDSYRSFLMLYANNY